MTSEAPRRRASDQLSVTSPRASRPAATPESDRNETHPDGSAVPSLAPSFTHLGNGRANASRERRRRDMEWHGPERRISGRF